MQTLSFLLRLPSGLAARSPRGDVSLERRRAAALDARHVALEPVRGLTGGTNRQQKAGREIGGGLDPKRDSTDGRRGHRTSVAAHDGRADDAPFVGSDGAHLDERGAILQGLRLKYSAAVRRRAGEEVGQVARCKRRGDGRQHEQQQYGAAQSDEETLVKWVHAVVPGTDPERRTAFLRHAKPTPPRAHEQAAGLSRAGCADHSEASSRGSLNGRSSTE